MKKYFFIWFFFIFLTFGFSVPDFVDIGDVTIDGWNQIDSGHGIDDSGDVLIVRANKNDGTADRHSLFYNKQTKANTDLGLSTSGDPLLAWGLSANGQVVCGFDKKLARSFIWQPGLGFTYIESDVTDYDSIHANGVNNNKAIVGYLSYTGSSTGKRKAFYKKVNGDIESYSHADGGWTEFTSINTNGLAMGKTEFGCVFSYNINNGTTVNISGPCTIEPESLSINNNRVAFSMAAPTPVNNIYPTKNSNVYINSRNDLCYDVDGKIYIWNQNDDIVTQIIFPGYENDYLTIGAFSENGTMVINSNEQGTFIARRIKEVSFETPDYSNLYYTNYNESFVLDIIIGSQPNLLNFIENQKIPIRIIVEIDGVSDDGSTIRYNYSSIYTPYSTYWRTYIEDN